jgi:sulfate adenylyltransferase subunit 1
MELLRFFTAGNVDDGKSTLIGRLLYDSHSISTDIIEALTRQKKEGGAAGINLAQLTDGLRAEREQGITIDVAYKYFTTARRKFIIADTPGHFEYTRNMFTGASNAAVAIILIDAKNGITEQTKRHSVISSILRIPQVVVCINKMDLIQYSEEKYRKIESDYLAFAKPLGLQSVSFIPVSALAGDNVVKASGNMSWYRGKSLLEFLETVELNTSVKEMPPRFQVQYIIEAENNYRGLAGRVVGGVYTKGQSVTIMPSGIETSIEKIEVNQQEVAVAEANTSVVLHLKDQRTVSRGSSIVPGAHLLKTSNELIATLCWMDNAAYVPGQKIVLQQSSFRVKALIKEVISKIDIHSLEHLKSDGTMNLNDICKVRIETAEPVSFDSYSENRHTGAFILINETTNNTIAAGTIG